MEREPRGRGDSHTSQAAFQHIRAVLNYSHLQGSVCGPTSTSHPVFLPHPQLHALGTQPFPAPTTVCSHLFTVSASSWLSQRAHELPNSISFRISMVFLEALPKCASCLPSLLLLTVSTPLLGDSEDVPRGTRIDAARQSPWGPRSNLAP